MSFHVSGCSPVYSTDIYDEDYIETMEIVGMNDKGQEVCFLLPEEAVPPFLEEATETPESYKKSMQAFLDEHLEYVPSTENLIEVDEMPGAMQQLHHAMAKNVGKYTLSAGTAFQLGKLYLSDHESFRADSAKAGMWFLIATTKDKSLKAEATKLQQQKAR